MRPRSIAFLAAVPLLAVACSSTNSEDAETTDAAVETTVVESATTDAPDVTAAPDVTDAPEVTEVAAPIPGVDGDTVKVGFVVVTNGAAASEQAGAEGVTTIAQDKAVQLLVDDLNARGGIDGKTVEPVLFTIDATANVDQQTIVREYCATFTQDNEVYAVLSAGEPGPEQLACLADAGVPAIAAGGPITFFDDAVYESNPLLVNINGLSLDAAATSLVEGLDTQGWFDGASVGIVRLQDDAFDGATERSLLPALEAAGVTVSEEVAIAAIQSQDDIGRVSTEAQAAVLKMKDGGVDHIIFFESGGALPFFFLNAATEQGYSPELGFGTTSGGQTLVENIKRGGTGIGWSPIVDVPVSGQPPVTEATQACFDLLDPTGAAFVTATAQSQATSFCDIVSLLEVSAADGLSDGAGVIAAIEALGGSFAAASVEKATFAADKHFGVSEYRLVQYDPACGCNVYTAAPPTPVR